MKDDPILRETLRAWRYEPAVPRSFNAEVWQKIEARKQATTASSLAEFFQWLFPTRQTWQWATATAAVMMLAGVALGGVVAGSENRQVRSALAQRYVQTVDPYLQASHLSQ